MRLHFPPQVLLIEQSGNNKQLAEDVFAFASGLPSTATCGLMVADGYHSLQGMNCFQVQTCCYICYKDCLEYLLKPLTPAEAARAKEFDAALSASDLPQHPGIVSFELRWDSHRRSSEDPEKSKCFMLMPFLHATLELMPPLTDAHSHRFWADISAALAYLHALGFAHCDVKPANICVRTPVSFVLIDLGSVARFGDETKSTTAYVPCDSKEVSRRWIMRVCRAALRRLIGGCLE